MNIEWNAAEYQDTFSFVPAYGEDVMKLLTAKPGSRVLDLGCGDGALTQRLAQLGYDAFGVDGSPDMVAAARANHPGISFMQGDATDFHLAEPVDAVFSNAVLHWIDADKQRATLANIAANIKQGGEFVFEFGGAGCAEAIHGTLERIFAERGRTYLRMFYFPTIGQYAPLVEAAGMRVEFAVLFDRPTPQKEGKSVKDWIRMFDGKPFEDMDPAEKEEIVDEAVRRLRDTLFANGTWYVDYVRIRMRARKL